MATQRCPQLLLGLPHDVLATRIAALLPTEDRQERQRQKFCSARPPAPACRAAVPDPAAACALPCHSTSCRLRLSHTCRALRAASTGWFPEVRVDLDEDTDAEALGGWLRRIKGECGCGVLCSACVAWL